MPPITDFLSCTDPLDEFDSLLYHQTHLPGAGSFYDHSESKPAWGQDPVYAFYMDHKTSYPNATDG